MSDARPVIAMVALQGTEPPDPSAVVAAMQSHWGHHGPVEMPEDKDGTAVFSIGGHHAFVSHMPGPIPWGDLEWPVQVAGWYWPEAEQALRAHQTHCLVGVMGARDTIDAHLVVTHLAAAVCTLGDAIGVYWGDAGVVAPVEMFVECATGTDRDNLPINLWISLSWGRSEGDPRLEMATHGLAAFGHVELATRTDDPDQTVGFLYDIAHYLITSGAQLENGQTLGSDASERIPITHGPAPWDDSETVAWLGD